MDIRIRPATIDETPQLQHIEVRAGEAFRSIGMESIADAAPPTAETLVRYATAGRSWVAVDEHDIAIAYVLVDVVDGNAHIEQVSVLPDYQGRGIGRALIDEVRGWAAQSGRSALTLTTFGDVPWNAPLYEHLGLRVLAEHEIGPELARLRDDETSHGLDPATRVCMRLDIAEGVQRSGGSGIG